jgi:hypothetical protein
MASEDITFCANKGCPDMKCERNPKHIRLLIPHSFALFEECPKWKPGNALWLRKQLEDINNGSLE